MATQAPIAHPPYSADTAAGSAGLMVVGIGASAGGLKALQQFVEAIPADSGMAFVVIVHLDPYRASRMAELLQDRAGVPVTQVEAVTKIQANHIYVIPPGSDLAMNGTRLALRERGARAGHAPVDLFFLTLAVAFGADSAGVILSGSGSDGTAGIRYIREAGGLTLAQSPDESEYDGMPASAISTGLVDLVLPAAQIPAELIRLRRQPWLVGTDKSPAPDSEASLSKILLTLRRRVGHDFSLYKRSTVLRRLDRRVRVNGCGSLDDYLAVLQSSGDEAQALLRDLLISVSGFFRDPDAFDALTAQTPALFSGKGPSDTVRVWVVGCATGEEVYSIAMVLAEHAATLEDPPRLQLFATDIDEKGYAWGRAGLYSAAAVADVPPERLERFFTTEAGSYRIAKSLRELVLFAGHNALQDPPFSRMDLISCRNLFIYLQPEAQEQLLETFHYALNPAGLLFLGTSESVGESPLFAPAFGGAQRLYRRSAASSLPTLRLSAADPRPHTESGAPEPAPATPAAPQRQRFSYGALHVRMLEQYAPASVIVNERLEVVHMSSHAGRFLTLTEGEPTHNLLKLVPADLRTVLRTALHHAFADRTPTSRRARSIIDGATREVVVEVRPTKEEGSGSGRFALVFFQTTDSEESSASAGSARSSGRRRVETELAEELRATRDLLDATNAAHDRTVAELQTMNEELQSTNEEQKAATEELETSREEIQSINEELITINQEHQGTIEELKRTNADLQNLIASTEIGTIFLDRELRIRRLTPATTGLFNLVAEDHGRPLSHFTHRLNYDGLVADVETVLGSLERLEREVGSDTGQWYIVRINPYRSMDGAIDGVVLTFFDNTAQHSAAEELREAKSLAEAANLAKGTFLSTLSHEFRTPLNAILGYADLLELGGTLDPAQAKKVERIKAGGWHLVSMIEEILSFAKLDGGHEVVETATIDTRALAQEAGALIEPAAAAKGLTFVLDLPSEPVNVTTDAGKARQILINLCGNAVKYTGAGEVRVRVRGEAEHVRFEISDTGVGIAAEHQARIFERFWQVDGGATRVGGGLGIGLAAAREYARLLGGDVTVESAPGQGSTFRVWLPRGEPLPWP
jgi:two-component system, chemotaxis family, CheB/CheR fusion protein